MRLTRFNNLTKEYEYHLNNPNTSMIQDEITGIQKLGQLEDLEEEYCVFDNKDLKRRLDLADKYGELSEQIGVDLITFFKIYNADKVYIKGKDYYWKIKHYNRHSITVGTNKTICLPFKEYGKTWALTKEELL